MAFQVVELTLDADQNVVDRGVIPYPYPTRKEAVDAIESVVTNFPQTGYQSENDSWWAIPRDGTTHIKFAIEFCLRRRPSPTTVLRPPRGRLGPPSFVTPAEGPNGGSTTRAQFEFSAEEIASRV